MRKGLFSCPFEDACTKVYDHVSATIPDQSIGLKDLLVQFAYIGEERVRDIIERGFYDDEDDDDVLGYDVGALDFAEVHDRMIELQEKHQSALAVHAPQPVEKVPDDEDSNPVDSAEKSE